MPAVSTLIGLGLFASAGSTMAQIHQSNVAANQAEGAANRQEKATKKLLTEAKNKEKTDAAETQRDQKRAKQRTNQLTSQSANKGGTDLIGQNALGALFAPMGGSNPLLGA